MAMQANVAVTSLNMGSCLYTDLGRCDVQSAWSGATTYAQYARCTYLLHVFESIAGGNTGNTPAIGGTGSWYDAGLVEDLGRIVTGLKWIQGILLKADATGGTPNIRFNGRTGPLIYSTALGANATAWIPINYPIPLNEVFITQSGPTASNVETPHVQAYVFVGDPLMKRF